MATICELEINNKSEKFDFNKVAKQSNGSVLYTVGNTVLMATVVSEFDNPVNEDFTPLTVQYIERAYSAAKFVGGFVKREGKPNDFETLTSRIIDRSLRPLFPKGYIYPTTITVMVLSVDTNADLQVLALNAASAALYISNLPINKSICATRVARLDKEFILNPTLDELEKSTLDLYVAGSSSELLMIEMKSNSTQILSEVDIETFTKIHAINDISEDELVEAIQIASENIFNTNKIYEDSFQFAKMPIKNVQLVTTNVSDELINYIKENQSIKAHTLKIM